MNIPLIRLFTRITALSALVSAFMSYFFNITIPGLTYISIGLMFLCYALLEFMLYNQTKKAHRIIGISAYTLAFIVVFLTGVSQILK